MLMRGSIISPPRWLRGTGVHNIVHFDGHARRFHIGPQLFATFKAVKTGVWSGIFIQASIRVHHIDDGGDYGASRFHNRWGRGPA